MYYNNKTKHTNNMRNKKDIDRKLFYLSNEMDKNISGGTINLTGCIDRYTVGAKNIFTCNLEHFESDRVHYLKRIEEELKDNYLFLEFPIEFDTLGYWVDNSNKKPLLYVDLGFRMSDKSSALKFASFNGELAIWDNKNQKEILVNNYKL